MQAVPQRQLAAPCAAGAAAAAGPWRPPQTPHSAQSTPAHSPIFPLPTPAGNWWNVVFFGRHQLQRSTGWMGAFWASIAASIAAFYRVGGGWGGRAVPACCLCLTLQLPFSCIPQRMLAALPCWPASPPTCPPAAGQPPGGAAVCAHAGWLRNACVRVGHRSCSLLPPALRICPCRACCAPLALPQVWVTIAAKLSWDIVQPGGDAAAGQQHRRAAGGRGGGRGCAAVSRFENGLACQLLVQQEHVTERPVGRMVGGRRRGWCAMLPLRRAGQPRRGTHLVPPAVLPAAAYSRWQWHRSLVRFWRLKTSRGAHIWPAAAAGRQPPSAEPAPLTSMTRGAAPEARRSHRSCSFLLCAWAARCKCVPA